MMHRAIQMIEQLQIDALKLHLKTAEEAHRKAVAERETAEMTREAIRRAIEAEELDVSWATRGKG